VLQSFNSAEEGGNIDITLVDCAPSDYEIQRGKEEFYVYIVYTGTTFQLWLPQIDMSAANWLLKGASTKHVKASLYKLVLVETATVPKVSFQSPFGGLFCCAAGV
jgi:hypothetical protein